MRIKHFVQNARQRLRGRTDSEHEMSFNRLVIAGVFTAFLLLQGHENEQPALIIMALYLIAGCVLLGHIFVSPGPSPARRFVALVLDTACMSFQTYVGGEAAAAFFPIYLWISFGNGFRFGLPALFSATVVTSAGAGITLLTSEYWQSQMALGVGLWCSLLVLPGYAGTLINRLSKARQQAEAANAAKTLFLANVSHELRTPLTAILGMGRLLQATRQSAEQNEMTATVQTAAGSLLALIDDLLQLSRLDAGRDDAEAVPFNMPQLLVSVRQIGIAQAHEKGITLSVHASAEVPMDVIGGERFLREILTNLAGNAIKFTQRGGVLISVSRLDPQDGATWLRFEVTDTGIGIAPGAAARIFEPFAQADATIAARFGGTGLGLAISRGRALALGGHLSVESTQDQGSCFRLDLPFTLPVDAAPSAPLRPAVCVLAPAGFAPPWSPVDLSTLTSENTVMAVPRDPRKCGEPLRQWYETQRQQAPCAVLLCVDGTGWTGEAVHTALAACTAVVGPHVILVSDATQTLEPSLRWACASMLTGPASFGHLAASLQIGAAHLIAPPQGEMVQAGPALHLLVAEDNSVNQKVLLKLLERAGHTAELAEDGEAALDLLAARPERFDAVLMDVNMPHMDGLEATKLFRFTAADVTRLPIIGVTADATEAMADRCREAGMDACLSKPYDMAEVMATLRRLASRAAGTEPRTATMALFQPPSRAEDDVLDERVLHNLGQLGGPEFTADLVADFRGETRLLVGQLDWALRQHRLSRAYGHAHTLRSISNNIGANALAALCKDLERLGAQELEGQADDLADRVSEEFRRLEEAFEARGLKLAASA